MELIFIFIFLTFAFNSLFLQFYYSVNFLFIFSAYKFIFCNPGTEHQLYFQMMLVNYIYWTLVKGNPRKMPNMIRWLGKSFLGFIYWLNTWQLALPLVLIHMRTCKQFFLGDYRPLVQDTHGNVLDQVS